MNNRNPWPDVLRLYVGAGKRVTFDALADATDIPPRTLRSYAAGEHAPRWDHVVALIQSLPKQAGDMAMAPAGYRLEPLDADGADHMEVLSAAASLTSGIADALANDGKVDHREAAIIEPLAQEAHDAAGRWLAKRRGAKDGAPLRMVGADRNG